MAPQLIIPPSNKKNSLADWVIYHPTGLNRHSLPFLRLLLTRCRRIFFPSSFILPCTELLSSKACADRKHANIVGQTTLPAIGNSSDNSSSFNLKFNFDLLCTRLIVLIENKYLVNKREIRLNIVPQTKIKNEELKKKTSKTFSLNWQELYIFGKDNHT